VQARRTDRPRSRPYVTCCRRAGTLSSFLPQPLSSPRSPGRAPPPASSAARSPSPAGADGTHPPTAARRAACPGVDRRLADPVPLRNLANRVPIRLPDDPNHLLAREPRLPHPLPSLRETLSHIIQGPKFHGQVIQAGRFNPLLQFSQCFGQAFYLALVDARCLPARVLLACRCVTPRLGALSRVPSLSCHFGPPRRRRGWNRPQAAADPCESRGRYLCS